jgi:glycine cleavage system H protein
LGDVTFVELPEVGTSFSRGEVFGVVESVKAASDLYMPVGGEILEVNEELGDSPEKLNESPYGDGWIIKIKSNAIEELSSLLTADQYKEEIGKI